MAHVEAALSVLDRLARLALEVVVVDQIGVDAGQARLVAQIAGEPLGLARNRQHVVEPAQLEERRPQVQAKVDRLLERLPRFRQSLERGERVLEGLDRLAVRRVQHRALADLPVVDEGLRPDLAPRRVKRELVDVARAAVVVQPLDCFHDPRVQNAPLLPEQARVGDVARERALEAVHDVGEKTRLVEEPRDLEARQRAPDALGWNVHDRLEQRLRHVRADHGRRLEQELFVVREPIDAGGEDGLHGRRNLERLELADQAPGPAFADERLGLDEGPDDLLEEKGVAVAPLDQKLAERPQRAVVAEQRVE